jgi:hypothetical protein
MIETTDAANRSTDQTSEIRRVAMHHESTPDKTEYQQGAGRHTDRNGRHDDAEYHGRFIPS